MDLELFDAQQNARVIRNAENYYRSLIEADQNSWNIRENHMVETLEELLKKYGPHSRAIVWAHNSHVGDYRATEMLHEGLVTMGGLIRQKFGQDDVAIVGFGTDHGTVTAASAWGGRPEATEIPSAIEGSYENAFHRVAVTRRVPSFMLLFDHSDPRHPLYRFMGHRAIGVVYDGWHEGRSRYVPTALAARYDAFIFLDETKAIARMRRETFVPGELPQTWPSSQ
jgi:erythromycin esterase-like protein